MSLTAGQQRKAQRATHLAAAMVVFTSVYLPTGMALSGFLRWVAFPVLVVTGLLMWQAARIRQALRRVRGSSVLRPGAS